MSRYIDADKTLDALEGLFDTNYWGNTHLIDRVLTVVYNQPTADVAPIVHAHWLGHEYEDDGVTTFLYHVPLTSAGPVSDWAGVICSNCKHELGASDEYCVPGRYCPNCGAKMDEEDNQ